MQAIVYEQENGVVAIVTPAEGFSVEQISAKDIPAGVEHFVINYDEIPSDRVFRDAWILDNGKVVIDLTRAKSVAHQKRRLQRLIEMEPHDKIIALQIPGTAADTAEAARLAIRQKYAVMQQQIDAAQSPDELKLILGITT